MFFRNIYAWKKRMSELESGLKDTEIKLSLTSEKLKKLEAQLRLVDEHSRIRGSFEHINEATKILGTKSLKENHNYNYLGNRLSDYELALLNVKQMGYYIGLAEAVKSGSFDKCRIERAPTVARLPSKLCTQKDCESDWYYFWLKEICCGFTYHRKLWEFCYIAQNLYSFGALEEGKKGVGFGCGEEPLPSLFAKYGASTVVTDLDPKEFGEESQGWADSGQHANSLEKLLNRSVCPDPEKLAKISHQFVNMNRIPSNFDGQFDFCWSACALEHLGSIKLGLEFIENSLKTLKPDGVAVHTTEYNLDDGETIDNCFTVLFQRAHLEELKVKLESKGYFVSPLDMSGGGGVLDGLFDIPPWPWDAAKLGWQIHDNFAHLKRSIGGFPCTSVGITISKRRT